MNTSEFRSEHNAWLGDISHWLIEHQRALADLRQRVEHDCKQIAASSQEVNDNLREALRLVEEIAALSAELIAHANHVMHHQKEIAAGDSGAPPSDGSAQARHRVQHFDHERLRRRHSKLIVGYAATLQAPDGGSFNPAA